ncbi:hypothetical protein [Anthocerotibacter panamensis]|uniref:hypothetical protein n=1 Tax=Anthocerotibacter panamensis TaxID=2857077 RepID=UPI001C406F34|nr:hypothetical protein [Anthocerotibacter panamensis]
MTATIPPNAPTAPISVVTPSGTTQTAQNFVPTNVPTAPRQAQFDLRIAAQQILQFYENNQRTFDALGQIAQGLFYEGLGSVGGAAGGAGFSLSLTADATGVGLPIGIAAGVASAGLIAASAGSVVYGDALLKQGVKGLLEQQYYAASTNSPNPGGKLGDAVTRQTAANVRQDLKLKGFDVINQEVKFAKGPVGLKTRFADFVAQNTKTGQTLIIQIGKLTKSGIPVIRERRALDDIIFSPTLLDFKNSTIIFVEKGASGLP